ncbi:MAG TPA: hypothetical protein VI911_12130 [Patescibacteria group bacterium]|nr:hypothetical protein [Patescibacteria group bacterium]
MKIVLGDGKHSISVNLNTLIIEELPEQLDVGDIVPNFVEKKEVLKIAVTDLSVFKILRDAVDQMEKNSIKSMAC